MKTSFHPLLVGFVSLSLAACAHHSEQYDWGDYEDGLYTYYKDPATAAQFADSLRSSIADAEASGTKVPPGLYAEYGNLMLQSGNYPAAIEQFNREKTLWPESSSFMDTMIKSATAQWQRTSAAAAGS